MIARALQVKIEIQSLCVFRIRTFRGIYEDSDIFSACSLRRRPFLFNPCPPTKTTLKSCFWLLTHSHTHTLQFVAVQGVTVFSLFACSAPNGSGAFLVGHVADSNLLTAYSSATWVRFIRGVVSCLVRTEPVISNGR